MQPGSTVIPYAGIGGALVDHASDLDLLLNLRGDVVLDGHPRPGDERRVTAEFREQSIDQQAIGVLIARARHRTPPVVNSSGPPGVGHHHPEHGRRRADPRRRGHGFAMTDQPAG